MLNRLRLLQSGFLCGLIVTCLVMPATGDDKQSEARSLIAGLRGPMDVREADTEALVAMGAGAVEPLIQELRDADPNYRALVAAILGEIKDNRAVEPLKGLLGDKDYTVRAMAATALGKIGDPTAIELLVKLLAPRKGYEDYVAVHASYALAMMGEPAADALIELLWNYIEAQSTAAKSGTRPTGRTAKLASPQAGARASDQSAAVTEREAMGAVLALGEMRETRAIPELIGLLRERTYNFSDMAGEALAKIGQPAIVPMLDAVTQGPGLSNADHTRKALALMGEASIPTIVQGLKSKNYEVGVMSAWVLGRALQRIDDPPAVEALVAALKDGDFHVSREAEIALGDSRDPRAVEPLIALLKDRKSDAAWKAARALGRIGDRRAVEPLIASLQYLGRPVDAVRALDAIGDSRAANALLPGLTDRDPEVRAAVAHALGVMRCAEAVKPLIGLLGDNSPSSSVPPGYPPVAAVKWIAAEALGNIGDKSAVEPIIALLRHMDRPFSALAVQALGRLKDPRAVKLLIGMLNDPDIQTRNVAVGALGEIGDGAAVAPLVAKLVDSDVRVASAAEEALVRIGPDAAFADLVEALIDKDPAVRRGAARALGGMGDPRAVEPLGRALEDTDEGVRASAAGALGEIPGRASIDQLVSALDDNFVVERAALESLRGIGDSSCTDALTRRLGESVVGRYAAAALNRIKDPRAVPSLIAHSEVEGVARALGEMGDARAVDPLIGVLRAGTAETRTEAAWALARFKDTRAVEPLIVLLRDGDPAVRAVAAGALGQIGDARAIEPLLEALKDKGPYLRGLVRASAAHGDPLTVCMVQPELIPLAAIPNLGGAMNAMARWSDLYSGSIGSVRDLPKADYYDAYTRGVAAYCIGEYKAYSRGVGVAAYCEGYYENSSAVDALVAALKDGSPYVRAHAFLALCKMADPRFADAVIDALRNEPAGFGAAWGLRGFKDSRVCPALIEASNDPRPETRVMALLALSQTEDQRATDRVKKAMTDDRSRFVRAVLRAASAKAGKAIDAGQSGGQ